MERSELIEMLCFEIISERTAHSHSLPSSFRLKFITFVSLYLHEILIEQLTSHEMVWNLLD